MKNSLNISTGHFLHKLIVLLIYRLFGLFHGRVNGSGFIQKAYSNTASKYGHENEERHNRIFMEILSRLPKQSNSILDVGCGNGGLLKFLNENYNKKTLLIGVDFSFEMLKCAKDASFVCVNASAEKIPFNANSFDAVVSSLCFHHLPNRAKALSEIMQVLKPGGSFICCTAGEKYLNEIVSQIIALAAHPRWIKYFINQPPMYWPLSMKTFKGELENAGFVVSEIYDRQRVDSYKSVSDMLEMFNNITGQFFLSNLDDTMKKKFMHDVEKRLKRTTTGIKLTDHLIFSVATKKEN